MPEIQAGNQRFVTSHPTRTVQPQVTTDQLAQGLRNNGAAEVVVKQADGSRKAYFFDEKIDLKSLKAGDTVKADGAQATVEFVDNPPKCLKIGDRAFDLLGEALVPITISKSEIQAQLDYAKANKKDAVFLQKEGGSYIVLFGSKLQKNDFPVGHLADLDGEIVRIDKFFDTVNR